MTESYWIYNASGRDLNLNGLSIGEENEVDFTVEGDLNIAAGAYIVFGSSSDPRTEWWI